MEEKEKDMRLFDTELFEQEWFGNLTPRLKLLYIYALMKCDCAGILELNLRRFTFDLNCIDEPVNRSDIFDSFGNRIVPIGDRETCTKAIIPDFIRFHYGKRLVNDRRHNIHMSVVKRLKSVGLTLEDVREMATKKFEFDDFDDVSKSVEQGELFPNKNTEEGRKSRKHECAIPTLEEVRQYFKLKGTSVDPEEFWSKYQSVGWVDKNGNRIKDWKRCLVTWEKFRRSSSARNVKHGDNWRGGDSNGDTGVL